jgi:hypothetical protein
VSAVVVPAVTLRVSALAGVSAVVVPAVAVVSAAVDIPSSMLSLASYFASLPPAGVSVVEGIPNVSVSSLFDGVTYYCWGLHNIVILD